LAEEFKNKISVNALALGAVNTEMLQQAFPNYKAPINANQMANYIADFTLNGDKYFNGQIIKVALSNP
jgi:NAD(P)-dependent dehydrogenase (short-subunit alcohol dehydrogenase family)